MGYNALALIGHAYQTDARVRAEKMSYSPDVWEAAIAVDVPETCVLLDGYTRSVVFMREAPADGRFAIWLPVA